MPRRVLELTGKVLSAQRDICEAQHHILADTDTPAGRALIRLRFLSAIEHLASAAQEAERGA